MIAYCMFLEKLVVALYMTIIAGALVAVIFWCLRELIKSLVPKKEGKI